MELPCSTSFPASILCFKTIPFSFEESSSFATVTWSPKSVNVFLASSSDFPIIDGTDDFFTPVLTCIITVSPALTVLFASVSWLITYPASIFLLSSSTIWYFKFASSNSLIASSWLFPFKSGTVDSSIPLLTTTFIVVPIFML